MYHTTFIHEQYGLKAYNFGVSAESFHGILRKLQWIIKNHCKPKTIFIPLNADQLLYMTDFSLPPYILNRMDPPDIVTLKGYKSIFYLTYVFSLPTTKSNLLFLFKDSQEPIRIKYNFLTGDTQYLWDEEFAIDGCPVKIENNKKNLKQAINILQEIKKIADKSGIDIVLLWNPLPIDYQVGNEQILLFLELIGPLFHFINRIPLEDHRLKDSRYYYDRNHFKESLAKDVLLLTNKINISLLIEEIRLHQSACKNARLSDQPGIAPRILNPLQP